MALNAGVISAGNDGYKWILTMDQDSHFENGDFFSSVLDISYVDAAIIAASYTDVFYRPKPSAYPGLTEVAFVITSGNILNIAAWRIAGGFIDKMFIDEVDNEFCIRARNMGFKILATNPIYLHHKLGEGLSARHFLTRKEIVLTRHSPLRVYYTVRNNLYIWRKFVFSDFGFVANRARNIATLLVKITLYFPEKKAYLRFIAKAVKDSTKGRYGKFSG
jgi:rhamnosyltransferase